MAQKELFVTIKFSLGEAPSLSDLKNEGVTLQDYVEDCVSDLLAYLSDEMKMDEAEVKGSIKTVKDGQ